MLSIRTNILATCSFEAFPFPVMACFILFGAYSKIGTSRYNPAAIPTCNFEVMSTVCEQNVEFKNNSSANCKYNWKFGDNFSDSAYNTQHYYSDIGSYDVILITTAQNGCNNSFFKSIEIFQNTIPSFDTIFDFCEGAYNFLNKSEYASSYQWMINDSLVSNSFDLLMTLKDSGNYTVTLIASNQNCADSLSTNPYY